MDKLSSLIPRVLRKRGLHDQAVASQAVFLANKWIEEKLPQYGKVLRATKLDAKALLIESDQSGASQELTMRAAELLEYLNANDGIQLEKVSIMRSRNNGN